MAEYLRIKSWEVISLVVLTFLFAFLWGWTQPFSSEGEQSYDLVHIEECVVLVDSSGEFLDWYCR